MASPAPRGGAHLDGLPACPAAPAASDQALTLLPARRATTTHLTVLGSLQTYSDDTVPDELLRLPTANGLRVADVQAAMAVHSQSTRAWAMAARSAARAPLALTVLGVSPTAGCGAGETLNAAVRRNSSAGMLSASCSIERSWGRWLATVLDGLMGATAPTVELNFKNAVAASYFSRCTKNRVGNRTKIVLLEVAPNVWDTDLRALLRAVHRAAPHAAVAFVVWPSQAMAQSPHTNKDLRDIEAAARDENADVLHVEQLLRRVTLGSQPEVPLRRGGAARRYAESWYAQRGQDAVHPNAWGHLLLGAAVAHMVSMRLDSARCHVPLTHALVVNGSRPSAFAASRKLSDQGVWERCWDTADTLPVAGGLSPWLLVDEGGAKRVRKLGLVSHSPGSRLRLGPLTAPASQPLASKAAGGMNCTLMQVELGYLVSATRANMGALEVSCGACACAPLFGFWAWQIHPFPLLEADARFTPSDAFVAMNATVTATSSFYMFAAAGQRCFVEVAHRHPSSGIHSRARQWVCPPLSYDSANQNGSKCGKVPLPPTRAPHPRRIVAGNESTVRIDTLSVQAGSRSDVQEFERRVKQMTVAHKAIWEGLQACGVVAPARGGSVGVSDDAPQWAH